nr:MAG TPA: hypothetical protein [Caudoviricetes sp.]
MPKIVLEDIEDYYTYFVLILNISEEIFWNADYSFLISVMENKNAYDNFMSYKKQQVMNEKK